MPSQPEYRLFRLEFETPVRFGSGKSASGLDSCEMTLSSDSLFSALCVEYINLFGEQQMLRLVEQNRLGRVTLSSLLPWQMPASREAQPEYYLPRPLLGGQVAASSRNTQIKKQLKRIPWIAVNKMPAYLDFVNTGEGDLEQFRSSFGMEVVWDRVNTRTDGDPLPYRVSAWQFFACEKSSSNSRHSSSLLAQAQMTSGLYMILRSEDRDSSARIFNAMESLGTSGIGGKTSSGLGKFIVWEDNLQESTSGRALLSMLRDDAASVQMLISTASPAEEDQAIIRGEDARYLLVARNGFSSSPNFIDRQTGRQLKRKTCILLSEGSVFPQRLSGCVLDLSYGGLHPVFRSGRAMHVGLNV